MASSLSAGGPGILGVANTVPRRPNLEFPPPPPYPPPHTAVNQLTMDMSNGSRSMQQQQPMMQRSLQDYSYAYYQPGPSQLHTSYTHEGIVHAAGVVHHPSASLQKPPCQRQDIGSKRHTYLTRYGTEENIYEEISEIR